MGPLPLFHFATTSGNKWQPACWKGSLLLLNQVAELSTNPKWIGRYDDHLHGTLLRLTLLAQPRLLSNSGVGDPNLKSQRGTVLVPATQLKHEWHGLSSVAMQQHRKHGWEHQKPYHGTVGMIGTTHQGCFFWTVQDPPWRWFLDTLQTLQSPCSLESRSPENTWTSSPPTPRNV